MATILEQIKRIEKLTPSVVVNKVFEAVKKAQGDIIKANKLQLVKGENVKGQIVGTYAPSTQGFADRDGIPTPKKEGDSYNFTWFNNFFDGFDLTVTNDLATIFSTGVGDGGKKQFLTSENLMGLNDQNLKEVIQKDILPFIQKYAKSVIGI